MPSDPSYIVFSEIIEAETKEDHQLLVNAAEKLWGYPDRDPVEAWPKVALDLLPVPFEDIYCNMPLWKPLKRNNGLVVYSKEGCSMHAVTPLIQRYLKQQHPDWYWWTEWAEVCDRPRPSGFRGGAVMITAERIRWHFTSRWVNNMVERVEMELA